MNTVLFLILSTLTITDQAYAATSRTSGDNSDAPASFAYQYKEVLLEKVIEDVATFCKKNVTIPTGAQAIKETITILNDTPLNAEQAWTCLYTYLELAGYTLEPRAQVYIIKKNEATLLKDAFPIVIGMPVDDIDNSDKIITYVYQLKNIQLPTASIGASPTNELKNLLEDLILDKTKPGQARVLLDAKTNTVIVTGKAYNIKVAMSIVAELDKTGYREVVERIQLQNTDASFVARFLREELLSIAGADDKLKAPGPQPVPTSPDLPLFSKSTKIVEEPRSNSLLVMGRAQTVEYLKAFIYKYIDVPLESGDSLIHVYDLQYLEAETFARDLERMLKGPQTNGQQSRGTAEDKQFEGVIIEAERSGKINALQGIAGNTEGTAQGGNRLIIAANKRQWTQILRLIMQLDKPQPQVSLEVFVVDVTLKNEHVLASQMRNPAHSMPKNINFQFAHIGAPVLDKDASQNCADDPTTLATNLLALCDKANIATNTQAVTPGSALLSFNDPNTSNTTLLLQFLQQYTDSRILSHPHLVTLNNKQASNMTAEYRRVTGQAKVAEGAVRIEQEPIDAHLKIDLLPRINLSNTINLQIIVDVQDFIDGGQDAKTIRRVQTNATVGNGEILVLGGLIDSTDRNGTTETPLLSKIPLIGWLFKARDKENHRNNLLVFICPTIVKPHRAGGMAPSTQAKFEYGLEQVRAGEMFDQLKDPITHWFFGREPLGAHDLMHNYETREFFITKYLEKEPIPTPSPVEEKVDRIIASHTDEALYDTPVYEAHL